MPLWFFIALIGPILYATTNHVDKYLISKYLKGGEVGSLIIFSSLFSFVALPIIFFINQDVVHIALKQGIILAVDGMIIVLSVLFYFYALHKDEASFVVPFYQTVPIFGFILGYLLLGETITKIQAVASLIIIFGAIILSLELGVQKIRFKWQVVLLMLGASLLAAINVVVFKMFAVDTGFWTATFWGLIGKIVIGFCFLVFIPNYRNQFLDMIKENKMAVLGLNSLSETLFIFAEGVSQFAALLAPVALVLLVNAFQPFFVFIIAILLSIFLPKISSESLDKKVLFQKVLGIGLMAVGGYFIGM